MSQNDPSGFSSRTVRQGIPERSGGQKGDILFILFFFHLFAAHSSSSSRRCSVPFPSSYFSALVYAVVGVSLSPSPFFPAPCGRCAYYRWLWG